MLLRHTALLALLLALPNAQAADKPDAKTGKTLENKNCVTCHSSRVGGDGSAIYTRPDRKVKSMDQLKSRIGACNTMASVGLFPEEEAHIAAYLNQTYYRFK